jgi:hypothetical protein
VGPICSEGNEEGKVVQLGGLVACILGPSVIINETQGWCIGFTQIFVPSKIISSAKHLSVLLVIPNSYPVKCYPQVALLKILDQILTL